MKKIVPFLITKNSIKWDIYSLDAYDGFQVGPNRLENDIYMIELEKRDYKSLKEGDVFIIGDPDEIFSLEEVSSFLMKKEFGDWYLTTDKDKPLGIDKGQYDYVLVVTNN
jgi:hypothetical protein